MNIKVFEKLVGKQIQAEPFPGVSVPLTVDKVDALGAVECDDENVCKNPFRVDVSGSLEQRLPEKVMPITGAGIPADTAVFIQPLADLNPDADKLPYEILFA